MSWKHTFEVGDLVWVENIDKLELVLILNIYTKESNPHFDKDRTLEVLWQEGKYFVYPNQTWSFSDKPDM